MIQEILVSLLLIGGASFILLAALGALRFRDSLTRMAAVSKASTLGLTLIFLAVIVYSLSMSEILKSLMIMAILWLTTPIAAHLLGRATLVSGEEINSQTQNQELISDLKEEETGAS